MSGFEVAGIVLGVLPLIIEGLKAGEEVLTTVDRLKNKHVYLARWISRLQCHCIDLEDVILKLAKRAGVSQLEDDSYAIAETLGKAKSEAFVAVLRDTEWLYCRLVASFKGLFPYEESLVERDPQLLRRLINLDSAKDRLGARETRQRIRFVRRKAEIDVNLQELRQLIDQLSRLATIDNDAVGPAEVPAPRLAKTHVNRFEKVQRAANQLFRAYARTIPGSCTSHNQHGLRLFLEPHSTRCRTKISQEVEFDVEFWGSASDTRIAAHHKSRVKVPEPEEISERVDHPTLSRQVSFQTTGPEPLDPDGSNERVDTFCVTLQGAGNASLVFQVCERGMLGCRKIAGCQRDCRLHDSTTLAAILQESSKVGVRKTAWTRMRRINLGSVVASSLLQLNCAGWVPERLEASAIRFYTKVRTLDSPPYDDVHPFLERCYPSCNATQCQSSLARHWGLDLAILLLELWEGMSLQEWSDRQKSPQGEDRTNERYNQAVQWFEQIKFEGMPQYNNAIIDCLEIAATSLHKWEARDFRERFWERVVLPLEQFCKDT